MIVSRFDKDLWYSDSTGEMKCFKYDPGVTKIETCDTANGKICSIYYAMTSDNFDPDKAKIIDSDKIEILNGGCRDYLIGIG